MKPLFYALAAVALAAPGCTGKPSPGEGVPLVFSGGHDIGPGDHGRPCVLIAAALGVKTEVFREAFSGVTPAKDRGPSGDEARRNKEALLKVLGPHGITNERIDEVSDFYRYRPQNGELWKHRQAEAHAVLENGKIAKVVVTDPGFGYSTPPQITVSGHPDAKFLVTLSFDKDFQKNGSIAAIEVVDPSK
jgi:hypothetical protein